MGTNRVNKSANNLVFGFIEKIIALVCPFAVRTVLIKTLGLQYVGLTSLFSSIIGALSLTELGFGGIIVFFMYRPIAEGNMYQLSALTNYYKKIFRIVGAVIISAGVLVLPFLEHFINGEYPTDINIRIVYLIMLFNTAISYLLFAYKAALLTASNRNDIESKVASLINIGTYIAQIASLLLLKNYYAYVIVSPIATIVLNLFRSKMVDRVFPNIDTQAVIDQGTRKEIRKKVLSAIGFKLDSTILSSADSIVISSFLGLSILGMYNNYLYIVTSLFAFINIAINSLKPSIGNSVVLESRQKNERDLFRITFLFSWVLGWCATCLLCLYQDFVTLWLGNNFLLSNSTVILLVIYFYVAKMIESINMFKDSLGYWNEDKWRPYVEGGFNLIVNLLLVRIIGLNGVILSTILSYLIFAYPTIIIVTYKKYFQTSIWKYCFTVIKYLFVSILVICVTFYVCRFVNFGGVFGFIAKCIICVLLPNLMFLVIYHKKEEFHYVVNTVKHLLKK